MSSLITAHFAYLKLSAEKGGQRFKPTVAKARPRQVEPSSRQLSSVPESQAVNSTPIPDEVVQAPSVLSDAAEAMNQQRRSGAGSEAARPIDDTLNQAPSVTRAASTEGSTSAENGTLVYAHVCR